MPFTLCMAQVIATLADQPDLDRGGFLPIGSKLPELSAEFTTDGIKIEDAQNSGLHFMLKTVKVVSQHSKMTVYGELFFLAGVAAVICLTICIIATLPSVAAKLKW